MHESRAVGRVGFVALDERMAVELAPDGRAKDAGAAAVDDMHRLQARESGVVHEEGPPERIFVDPSSERTRGFLKRIIEAGRL